MQDLINKTLPKLIGMTYNATAFVHPELAADWAMQTFCRIRKGSVRPDQAAFLESARQVTRQINGFDIQEYQWEGPGETVVLVHGWESNAARWRNLIDMLVASDFNVVAFDAPGHGRSTGKFLNVILYAECLDKIIKIHSPKHLVGHSVGGMTILYNEYRRPAASVQQIVTTGAPSEFSEVMDEYRDVLGLNASMMRALDRLVLDKFGFTIREFSTRTFAKDNLKKGLLIHDKYDPVTPYHASQKVHEVWKDSRLITTEGYGHSLHQADVNKAILDFLSEGS